MNTHFCSEDDRELFRLLFELESYLRVLVRWELRGIRPNNWQGMIPQKILTEAKLRREQERNIRYLDEMKSGDLSYLLLSELKDLIIEPLWDRFKCSWPPKDMVQAEFKKLLAIRNKVAHCRPVTERDAHVARRFAEDIADWTRHYRNVREYASSIDHRNSHHDQIFKDNELESWAAQWNVLLERGAAKEFDFVFGVRGHHIFARGGVMQGSIEPLALEGFMKSYERVMSFCSLGKYGEQLTCYVPKKAEATLTTHLLEKMVGVLSTAGEPFSAEEARSRFQVAGWEGILLGDIELPLEFSPSR